MRIQYLLLFSIFLLMSNCSQQEETEQDTIELILVEPSNESEVNHCCNVFQWDPIKNETQYRFQLSTKQDFGTNIIDTLINTDSFLIDYLDPSLTFYWKVSSLFNNINSDVFSFNVINYGELYNGEYEGYKTVYLYNIQDGVVIDTSYNETFNIQSTEDGKLMIGEDILHYEPTFTNNIIKLGLPTNYSDNCQSATIFLELDSLVYKDEFYGMGGTYKEARYVSLK